MDIQEEQTGDILTVALTGRLDAATSKGVEDHLLARIDGGARTLVLDLAGLDYISSVGLRVFVVAAKRLKAGGGSIVVCALKPSIQQVFEIAGFTKLFPAYDSRAAAISGLAG
jgi:anti-anti-sigma factor